MILFKYCMYWNTEYMWLGLSLKQSTKVIWNTVICQLRMPPLIRVPLSFDYPNAIINGQNWHSFFNNCSIFKPKPLLESWKPQLSPKSIISDLARVPSTLIRQITVKQHFFVIFFKKNRFSFCSKFERSLFRDSPTHPNLNIVQILKMVRKKMDAPLV